MGRLSGDKPPLFLLGKGCGDCVRPGEGDLISEVVEYAEFGRGKAEGSRRL